MLTGTRAIDPSACNAAGSRYAGVIAAMITPCRAPGEIDPAAATRLAGILASHGCDGIFVVSSTGESVLLDDDERQSLIAAARLGCPADKSVLYAGVSGFGIKQMVRQTVTAAAEGADVAVVMAPFFARISQIELRTWVTAVADASPIPICFYHHWRMPTPFETETVAALARHPNIVAMKETSEDAERIFAVTSALVGTRVTLLHGNERLYLKTLAAGGHGCVSALATIAPEWHRQLLDAWRDEDELRAERIQQDITSLWQMFSLDQTRSSFSNFVFTLKYAAHLRGWLDSTACMVPGFVATTRFREEIARHIRTVGLLDGTK